MLEIVLVFSLSTLQTYLCLTNIQQPQNKCCPATVGPQALLQLSNNVHFCQSVSQSLMPILLVLTLLVSPLDQYTLVPYFPSASPIIPLALLKSVWNHCRRPMNKGPVCTNEVIFSKVMTWEKRLWSIHSIYNQLMALLPFSSGLCSLFLHLCVSLYPTHLSSCSSIVNCCCNCPHIYSNSLCFQPFSFNQCWAYF